MMICPAALTFDSLLDVCVVGGLSRPERLRMLPRVFSGGHRDHPVVEFFRARSVRVGGLVEPVVQVDGEIVVPNPVAFRVEPNAPRVLVQAGG